MRFKEKKKKKGKQINNSKEKKTRGGRGEADEVPVTVFVTKMAVNRFVYLGVYVCVVINIYACVYIYIYDMISRFYVKLKFRT